jgi:hypothetical protein
MLQVTFSELKGRSKFVLEVLSGCEEMLSADLEKMVCETLSLSRQQYLDARMAAGITMESGCLFKKEGSNRGYVRHPDRVRGRAKLFESNKKFA